MKQHQPAPMSASNRQQSEQSHTSTTPNDQQESQTLELEHKTPPGNQQQLQPGM